MRHDTIAHRIRMQAEALAVVFARQQMEHSQPLLGYQQREEKAIQMVQNTPYGARIVAAFCEAILKLRREA